MEVNEFGPEQAPSDAGPSTECVRATATADGNPTAALVVADEEEVGSATPPWRVLGTVVIGWCTYLSMRFAYQLADRAAKVKYRPPGCDRDALTIPASRSLASSGFGRCVGEVRRVEWVASWRTEAVWAVFAVGAVSLVTFWIAVPWLGRRPERADPAATWEIDRGDWFGITVLFGVGTLGWWFGVLSTFSFPPGPGLSPAEPWLGDVPTAILTVGISIGIGVFYRWTVGWKGPTPTAEERRRGERRPWFRLAVAAAAWFTAGMATLITIQPGAGQRPWFSTTLQLVAMVYAALTAWMLSKRAGLGREGPLSPTCVR